jgi:hypothetical protein
MPTDTAKSVNGWVTYRLRYAIDNLTILGLARADRRLAAEVQQEGRSELRSLRRTRGPPAATFSDTTSVAS